jgi:hypothetical protein
MNRRALLVLLVAAALYGAYIHRRDATRVPMSPPPTPDSKPQPIKPKRPRPCPGPGPCPRAEPQAGGRPVEGGKVSPDGAVELVCDLPASERKKNIASKGLGCCVFRSIDYAARWQQVPQLYDLPEQMRDAGIEGGGYPDKVAKILAQFGPDVSYIQDTSGDPEILEAILKTGRLPCVTYNGRDCHYSGGIHHMVCLPYFDRRTGWACISDNNFPADSEFVWMSPDDFVTRWKSGGGGGWVVCLLQSPPPPIPHN